LGGLNQRDKGVLRTQVTRKRKEHVQKKKKSMGNWNAGKQIEKSGGVDSKPSDGEGKWGRD